MEKPSRRIMLSELATLVLDEQLRTLKTMSMFEDPEVLGDKISRLELLLSMHNMLLFEMDCEGACTAEAEEASA
jgi:hypothetical protein